MFTHHADMNMHTTARTYGTMLFCIMSYSNTSKFYDAMLYYIFCIYMYTISYSLYHILYYTYIALYLFNLHYAHIYIQMYMYFYVDCRLCYLT